MFYMGKASLDLAARAPYARYCLRILLDFSGAERARCSSSGLARGHAPTLTTLQIVIYRFLPSYSGAQTISVAVQTPSDYSNIYTVNKLSVACTTLVVKQNDVVSECLLFPIRNFKLNYIQHAKCIESS